MRHSLSLFLLSLIFLLPGCGDEEQELELIVQLSVDNPNFTGTCPRDFRFSGAVTSSQATTITYFWERSTGNSMPITQVLVVPGQLVVNDTVRLTSTGSATVRLHVTAPRDQVSVTLQVNATCTPPPPTD